MSDFPYVYVWGNNKKRSALKGKRCRILRKGAKGTVLLEFEDGMQVLSDFRAVRKAKDEPD